MNELPNGIDGALSVHATADTSTASADLLLARARMMAQEKPAAASDGSAIEVLEFGLADETYALELTYVREVGALVELAPLPGVPNYVLGITSARGQIIAVVDLRKLFGLPERGLRDSRQVIVLQSVANEFGILAEGITGVKWLPLAGVQPSLPTLTDVRAAYLSGIAPDGTVLLSAEKLLADPRLVVQQEV
jgi:purine-binding chemotaxis protein CheW